MNKKENLDYSLASKIYRLGQLIHTLMNQELAPLNLRFNHARVLHYISEHPGCTQKEIGEYLVYQPASMTNLIKLLEKKQMIERRRNPDNNREKNLYLLDEGKKVVEKTNKSFNHLNKLIGEGNPEIEKELQDKIDYLFKQIQKDQSCD